MAYTVFNPANLKTEITTGPLAATLAPLVSSSALQAAANVLNALDGPHAGFIGREPISAAAFIGSLDAAELTALTVLQLQQVQVVASAGMVEIGSEHIQEWVGLTWPNGAGPKTAATLGALFERAASRVELVFGPGIVVQASDVAAARDS